MMRILHPGGINKRTGEAGFILLRDLLVLFIVIICIAAALNALTVFVHQAARITRATEQTILERNLRLERLIQ